MLKNVFPMSKIAQNAKVWLTEERNMAHTYKVDYLPKLQLLKYCPKLSPDLLPDLIGFYIC